MFQVIAQASTADSRLLILVIGLVIIAVMLTALTIWYWRYTDPKRHPQTARSQSRAADERNPVSTRKSKSQGRPRNNQNKRAEPINLENAQPGRQDLTGRRSLRDRNERATSG